MNSRLDAAQSTLLKCLTALCLLTATVSCGLFGRKADLKKFLELSQGNTGCLNHANEQIDAFLKGDIAESQWNSLFDCAVDTLNLFQNFVKGSSDHGFTREDIQLMTSMVLVTDRPVSSGLVQTLFAIKASLLGGDPETLSSKELGHFIQLLRASQRSTTGLIPLLSRLKLAPTGSDLLAFADWISNESEGLSRILESMGIQGYVGLTRETASTFLDELKALYGWKFSNQFLDGVFAGKTFLTLGDEDQIEAANWPRLIRALGRFGGIYAALRYVDRHSMVLPNEYGEFVVELVKRGRNSLQESIEFQHGSIPLAALDHVIDRLPADWLTLNRKIVKDVLRPMVQKILETPPSPQGELGIQASTLDHVVQLAEAWRIGKTHLDTIFDRYGLDVNSVTLEEFTQASDDYRAGLTQGQASSDEQAVDRLVHLARDFIPLYHGSDPQISFTTSRRNSLRNLTQYHFSNFLVSNILRVYSKDFAHRPDKGSKEEFLEFWEDFRPMLGELKMLDPTVVNSGEKRFLEADVFTINGNGDDFLSIDEGTYYLPYLASIGVLTDRIAAAVGSECKRPEWGKDFYDSDWMEIECFRKQYYLKHRSLWDYFPELIEHFETMAEVDRQAMKLNSEAGARRYGVSQCPTGVYDAQGYAGIMHFVESMFARFDVNRNGRLSTEETLAAFPVFRRKIASIAGLDPVKDNTMLRAIFTYLIHYGIPPKDTFWGSVDFLRWKYLAAWNIKAERKDIYKIISLFSVPEISTNCGGFQPLK